MYTVHKNVQIILSLLKQFNIKNLVLSAGTRHIPLVMSAEDDDFFNCYSIVDERSAGFFALGLIQTTKEPACIVCTSGTAACNYVSAVNEAFYQHLPLVVLTSDRNRYYLNQQEDQCIPQINLFHDVCRKIVDLPIVRDDMDFWYCSRLVNEALLELNHREKGPVHINFQIDDNYPVEMGTFKFELPTLPPVKKIDRIMACDSEEMWRELAQHMKGKKIMVMFGQHLPSDQKLQNVIQGFCERYNGVVLCDHMGNLHITNRIENASMIAMLSSNEWKMLSPDIVITMNGHRMNNHKKTVSQWPSVEHWHVSPDGLVSDPFKKMNKIIECPIDYFFERMCGLSKEHKDTYWQAWREKEKDMSCANPYDIDFVFSSVYAVQGLFRNLKKGTLLHVANSNSIRIANMFPLPDGIDFFCNRGTCGIDGSMSTFIAQSYISKVPAYLVIGDLSFFYDMNALWNRYSSPRAHIMLCNNSGGAIFHSDYYKKVQEFPSIDRHVAASHTANARGWAESAGFQYICAHDKEEFEQNIRLFMRNDNDKPILFEVFTDKEEDIRQMKELSMYMKSEKGKTLHKIKESLPKPLKGFVDSLRH